MQIQNIQQAMQFKKQNHQSYADPQSMAYHMHAQNEMSTPQRQEYAFCMQQQPMQAYMGQQVKNGQHVQLVSPQKGLMAGAVSEQFPHGARGSIGLTQRQAAAVMPQQASRGQPILMYSSQATTCSPAHYAASMGPSSGMLTVQRNWPDGLPSPSLCTPVRHQAPLHQESIAIRQFPTNAMHSPAERTQPSDPMSFYRRFKKINAGAPQENASEQQTQKRMNDQKSKQVSPQAAAASQPNSRQTATSNIVVQDQKGRIQAQSAMNSSNQAHLPRLEPKAYQQLHLQYTDSSITPNQRKNSQEVYLRNEAQQYQKEHLSSDSSLSNGYSRNQQGIINHHVTAPIEGILQKQLNQRQNHSNLSMKSEALPDGIFRSQPQIIYEYNPTIQAYQKKMVSIGANASHEYYNPNQSNYSSYSPTGQNSFYSQQPLALKDKSNSVIIGAADEQYQMQLKSQAMKQNPRQAAYNYEEVHTPLTANRASLSMQIQLGQINDSNSAISYSANKQVRFTDINPQNNQHDDSTMTYQNISASMIEARDHSTKKRSVLSGSAKKRAATKSLNEKKLTKQSSSFISRNNRAQTNASKRSKSNKSQLSRKSSWSALSNLQKSQKKSRSKHTRSVSQQQVDEYNKFSNKQEKKSGGREDDNLMVNGKRNMSAKRRKSHSKSPKLNVASKNRKYQTIMIEADGLSNNQIRQIDRVSRILNNEKLGKSPGRRRSVSNKNRDHSAKRKSVSSKMKTLQTLEARYNSINSKETKSKNSNKTPVRKASAVDDGERHLIMAQPQPQQPGYRPDFGMQQPTMEQMQSYNMEAERFAQHAPQRQLLGLHGHHAQAPPNEMLVQPIQPNVISPKQFMTMHEYASPKYTLDYSANHEILLTNQINQHLWQQNEVNRRHGRQGQPASERFCHQNQEQMPEQKGQLQYEVNKSVMSSDHLVDNHHLAPPHIAADSLHTIQGHVSNQPTANQNICFTQNTLQPYCNPTQNTQHTHQTISPHNNNVGGFQQQHKPDIEGELIHGGQEQAHQAEDRQTFHNMQEDEAVPMDNQMIDQLSQMKEQKQKGQKSYNNDDINDVVPEANKDQEAVEKMADTDRSFITNTNTTTTHLTNALYPQTVHNRSKQTVGTDINLFSQKRNSVHGHGGEFSSNISANDRSLGAAMNLVSSLTSNRQQDNHGQSQIESLKEPSRHTNGKWNEVQDQEEAQRIFVQEQLNQQAMNRQVRAEEIELAERPQQIAKQAEQEEANMNREQCQMPQGKTIEEQTIAAPIPGARPTQQQMFIQQEALRYQPTAMQYSNQDLGSFSDRQSNQPHQQQFTNISSSRNAQQLGEQPPLGSGAGAWQQSAREDADQRTIHNAKFISFNDSQSMARNFKMEQQNLRLLQQQMGFQQSRLQPLGQTGMQDDYQHIFELQGAFQNQAGDDHCYQPVSHWQNPGMPAQLSPSQVNYHQSPQPLQLPAQMPHLIPRSMVATPFTETSALVSPMTSTYTLPHCYDQHPIPQMLHPEEHDTYDHSSRRAATQETIEYKNQPQIRKPEPAKKQPSRSRKAQASQPEAIIAIKLVKKGQKKADRSPSRMSQKSVKSKKSSKSQISKKQLFEISMNTLSSKKAKLKKAKSSRSESNISKTSKKVKVVNVTRKKSKLSQTQTIQDWADQGGINQQQEMSNTVSNPRQVVHCCQQNLVSPSAASPCQIIYVQDTNLQNGFCMEQSRQVRPRQDGAVDGHFPSSNFHGENFDDLAANQHSIGGPNGDFNQRLENGMSLHGPSGITFAECQHARQTNGGLVNITQIQNNQSMDEQDLELEQAAFEAFNIGNEKEVRADSQVDQEKGEEEAQTQNKWLVESQEAKEERDKDGESNLKQLREEQPEASAANPEQVKQSRNEDSNGLKSQEPTQAAQETSQGQEDVSYRLIYDPHTNRLYKPSGDGSLVPADQEVRVLQEVSPYSESLEDPQPAGSLHSLQSAKFCAPSVPAQTPAFVESRGRQEASCASGSCSAAAADDANAKPIGPQRPAIGHHPDHRYCNQQRQELAGHDQESKLWPRAQNQLKAAMGPSRPVMVAVQAQQDHQNQQAFLTYTQGQNDRARQLHSAYEQQQHQQYEDHRSRSRSAMPSRKTHVKTKRKGKSATPERLKRKDISAKKKKKRSCASPSEARPSRRPISSKSERLTIVTPKSTQKIRKVAKKSARSTSQAGKYQMSIDRIVQGPFRKLSQRSKSYRAQSTKNRRNEKSSPHSRSVSLLPPKRLITPAQRRQNITPKGRSRSALSKKKAAAPRNVFKRQQELIERLHSNPPRHSVSPRFARAAPTTVPHSPYRAHHQHSNRSHSASRCTTPTRACCGSTKCREQMNSYKQAVKSIEQAKYKRELEAAKQANEQKIRNLNQQCKQRLEYYKHTAELEKSRTKRYYETIKDMNESIDKVRSKNKALYAKIQKSNKNSKGAQNECGQVEGSSYIYQGGDCLKSTDKIFQSLTSQNQSTISQAYLASNSSSRILSNQQKTSRSRSRASKDKQSKKPQAKLDKPRAKSPSNGTFADRSLAGTISGKENNGDKINQLSTYDCQLDDQFGEDTKMSRLIDLQHSKMLEPNSAHVVSMKVHHTHQSSIDDIARGSLRQLPPNLLQVTAQQMPASHRAPHLPQHTATANSKPPDSSRTLLTQTSTTSTELPAVNLLSLTTKMKQNNQEIRRIENILYKNDKHTTRHRKTSSKLTANSAMVSEKMSRFQERARALMQNKQQQFPTLSSMETVRDAEAENKRSAATVGSHPRSQKSLIDGVSMQKVKKMEQIDKGSAMSRVY